MKKILQIKKKKHNIYRREFFLLFKRASVYFVSHGKRQSLILGVYYQVPT